MTLFSLVDERCFTAFHCFRCRHNPEKQAAYLLVALRQRILSIPQTYSRRLLGINDAKVMSAKLKEMSISILNDIKNLPQQVTHPNWLQTLENELS